MSTLAALRHFDFVETYPFLSSSRKQQIMTDWQQFYLNGFKRRYLTPELYQHLILRCDFSTHSNLEAFWLTYFNAEIDHLYRFISQFGRRDRLSAESGTTAWLTSTYADINQAMCDAFTPYYAAFGQLLQDLTVQHQDFVDRWTSFAREAGVAPMEPPPTYLVSENTRNMLSYAVQLIMRYHQPLPGLQQLMFHPTESQASFFYDVAFER